MATKQLFALSQGSGRFEACLQEIQEILGPDEVVHQMSLLAATTCEAVSQLLQEEAVEGQPRRSTPDWALSVKKEWCERIFQHGKSWEIRGCHCRAHLGERVAIAQARSGHLVGEVTIVESRELSQAELAAAVALHQVQDLSRIAYKRPHAWVLEQVQAYAYPKPYRHPSGCVAWIPLGSTCQQRRPDPRRSLPAKAAGGRARRKPPMVTWKELLRHRQNSMSYSRLQKDEHDRREAARHARLARKFPAIYGRETVDDAWMSARARSFREWCVHGAQKMCDICGRLVPQPYKASVSNKQSQSGSIASCDYCKSHGARGYPAPSPEEVPRRLRRLRPEVIEALRPFTIHCGAEQRALHGYAVHTDMLRFSFKGESVETALARLPEAQRRRGEKALLYLLSSEDSSYAKFWRLHHRFLHTRRRQVERGDIDAATPIKRLPVSFLETVGLECALWPQLYWRTEMTESYVRASDARRSRKRPAHPAWEQIEEDAEDPETGRRQSAKASFLTKVRSSVLGYGTDALLLQYVYDLWLFTTIGGARHSTSGTVREALASKPYSPELWRHYHAALVDLQRQIGLPQLFITVAPYEWSFPYHSALEDELHKCLRQRLHAATAETLHVAHVLSQAVKGLLTGFNEGIRGRTDCHVFGTSECAGVRSWVARLEFQDGKRQRHQYKAAQAYHGRGAVHVHILLWLEGMEHMDLAQQIRADIPGDAEPELRDVVLGSQLDWEKSGWPLREEPTRLSPKTGLLELHHPWTAYNRHCRAYLPDVSSALRCHADVVASDGRALILKYCSSPLAARSDYPP